MEGRKGNKGNIINNDYVDDYTFDMEDTTDISRCILTKMENLKDYNFTAAMSTTCCIKRSAMIIYFLVIYCYCHFRTV